MESVFGATHVFNSALLIKYVQGDTSPGGLGWVDFDLGCSKAGGPLL